MGRWISRDPIEEMGGLNIYGMLNNDAVGSYDVLGMGWLKRIKGICKASEKFKMLQEMKRRKRIVEKEHKSLIKQREAHKEKLQNYKNNPNAFDNQGHLNDAPDPDKVIRERIRNLQGQIRNFDKQALQREAEMKELSEATTLLNQSLCFCGPIFLSHISELRELDAMGGDVGVGEYLGGGILDVMGFFDPGLIDVYEWSLER